MSTMMPQKSVYWIRALGAVLLVVLIMFPGGSLAQPTVKDIVEQSPEENAKLKAPEGTEPELPKPTGPQDEFSRGVLEQPSPGFWPLPGSATTNMLQNIWIYGTSHGNG